MTVLQIATLFIALTISAYFAMRLRFGGGTPLLCLVWALAVVGCVVTFAGVR